MFAAVVDHLWESTLFVVVAWLLTLVYQNNAARIRYWVWLGASVKFLIPFSLLTMLGNQFSWRTGTETSSSDIFVAVIQQIAAPLDTPDLVLRAPQTQSVDFVPFLLSIWAVGCLLLLIRWSVAWLRVSAAVRKAELLAIQAPIAVKSTSVMSEPGVVGVFRPVLLLPEGIASRLSPTQMQAIVAHELCHVRRRDNLTAAIHMIVEALFWFHPLVWWIGARLVEERERACDEGVVELGNEPQAYAEGILKVCQFYMESKLKCVAGVSGANLKQRVQVIMKNQMVDSLNVTKKALLAATAFVLIGAPIVLGTLATSQVTAQVVGAAQDTFDVVSIRASSTAKSSGPAWLVNGDGHFYTKDGPVRDLVAFAYNVDRSRVSGGPDWIYTSNYSVEGKSRLRLQDGKIATASEALLVQSLLRDRFSLLIHRETQQVSSWVMTIADQTRVSSAIVPPRALPSDLPLEVANRFKAESVTPDRTGLAFQNATMPTLAKYLSARLGRPVVDQTGLAAKYNFGLTGKDLLKFDAKWVALATTSPTADPLPAAVEQQLGLKLELRMMPVEVVVIDSAQHPTIDTQPLVNVDSPKSPIAGSASVERAGLLKQRRDAVTARRQVTNTRPGEPLDGVASLAKPVIASVRTTPTADRITGGGPVVQIEDRSVSATSTTLRELIRIAYGGLPNQIVGGPAWMDSAQFDVTLKLATQAPLPVEPGAEWREMQSKLQDLLADRFKLIVRRDHNVVYTLAPVAGEVRLQKASVVADWRGVRESGQLLIAKSATAQDLIGVLSARLARPVLNRTGLHDSYDFELRLPASDTPLDAENVSSALSEQLGLSLNTLALPTLVIERAMKPGEVI